MTGLSVPGQFLGGCNETKSSSKVTRVVAVCTGEHLARDNTDDFAVCSFHESVFNVDSPRDTVSSLTSSGSRRLSRRIWEDQKFL